MIEVGKKINKWTYLGKSPKISHGYFKCDCGNVKELYVPNVTANKSQSCGCSKTNNYGLSTEDYRVLSQAWYRMKNRCYSTSFAHYKLYGGRGISVCNEWKNSLDNFIKWALSSNWNPELTLDRIDVNMDYTPQNCRWATWKTQGRNRRNCLYLTFEGETKCMSEWCEECGIPFYLAYNRYRRGWRDFSTIFCTSDLRRREKSLT